MQIAPPPDISLDDYAAIEEAVMETARGRWFLIEFARRQREVETHRLSEIASKLEKLFSQFAPPQSEGAGLASTEKISFGRPELGANGCASAPQAAPACVRTVAEKISDIVWLMRECGHDNLWCGQLMEQVRILRSLPESGSNWPSLATSVKSCAEPMSELDQRPLRRPARLPMTAIQKPGLARLDALSLQDKLALFC